VCVCVCVCNKFKKHIYGLIYISLLSGPSYPSKIQFDQKNFFLVLNCRYMSTLVSSWTFLKIQNRLYVDENVQKIKIFF